MYHVHMYVGVWGRAVGGLVAHVEDRIRGKETRHGSANIIKQLA